MNSDSIGRVFSFGFPSLYDMLQSLMDEEMWDMVLCDARFYKLQKLEDAILSHKEDS
jgi:hypothetical protein